MKGSGVKFNVVKIVTLTSLCTHTHTQRERERERERESKLQNISYMSLELGEWLKLVG